MHDVSAAANDWTGDGPASPALSIVIGHPSDLYVNQVYLDVFGVPGGYNTTYWVALLNSGYSRKFVTRQILKSR